MFMLLYPQLCWLTALDTMGLSWTTETWRERTSRKDKDS